MKIFLWAGPLAVLVFLWTLNEFLRGRLKELISGVLALLIFAVIGAASFISGWRWGLFALVGAFMLGGLFRTPALAVARRLIRHPDLGVEAYQRDRLETVMKEFGSDEYSERLDREKEADALHCRRAVANAFRREDVRGTLHRHGASERDLQALYERVEVRSLPPQLREQVLKNAELVEFFLVNSSPGKFGDTYVRNVTGQDVSMRLSLWASSNPGGGRPE